MSAEEIARLPPNVITRALGIREDVLVDVTTLDVEIGDQFLLCSDGLTTLVSDETILEIVEDSGDIEEAVRRLVDKANELGGVDNVTVVIGLVEDGPPPPADDETDTL